MKSSHFIETKTFWSQFKAALEIEDLGIGGRFWRFLLLLVAAYALGRFMDLSRGLTVDPRPALIPALAMALGCYATLDCFRKEHQPQFAVFQFMMPLPMAHRFMAKLLLSLFVYPAIFFAAVFAVGNTFQLIGMMLTGSGDFQWVVPYADNSTLIGYVYGHGISFVASAYFSQKSTGKMIGASIFYCLYIVLLVTWTSKFLQIGDGSALSFLLTLIKLAEHWDRGLIQEWKIQVAYAVFSVAIVVSLLGTYGSAWLRYKEMEVK